MRINKQIKGRLKQNSEASFGTINDTAPKMAYSQTWLDNQIEQELFVCLHESINSSKVNTLFSNLNLVGIARVEGLW